jgi:hypothetical protein
MMSSSIQLRLLLQLESMHHTKDPHLQNTKDSYLTILPVLPQMQKRQAHPGPERLRLLLQLESMQRQAARERGPQQAIKLFRPKW